MAVYYLDEYIKFAQEKLEEAKKNWRNGEVWDDEEYERVEFLEQSLKNLIEMRKHGRLFYTDF
jgi:hypothetical protein